MKNLGIVRTMDQFGRIVMPKELRDKMHIEMGDEIEVRLKGEYIVLEKKFRHCTLCGSESHVKFYRNKGICADCILKLKSLS
ncbi:MAG: AbrB/MazE/SpoVT family DNA-binding domain-containing protein [Bacillota bacterium]|nr:AbrB/MazE/SpoVT family DNA-binding domain-containing protein [Bacillota bacterium]